MTTSNPLLTLYVYYESSTITLLNKYVCDFSTIVLLHGYIVLFLQQFLLIQRFANFCRFAHSKFLFVDVLIGDKKHLPVSEPSFTDGQKN